VGKLADGIQTAAHADLQHAAGIIYSIFGSMPLLLMPKESALGCAGSSPQAAVGVVCSCKRDRVRLLLVMVLPPAGDQGAASVAEVVALPRGGGQYQFAVSDLIAALCSIAYQHGRGYGLLCPCRCLSVLPAGIVKTLVNLGSNSLVRCFFMQRYM
jgi:hypothetical protein